MKVDLHVHSCFSDGRERPEFLVEYAKKVGLDLIAITDHDTSEGAVKVKGRAILGQEVSTEHGHVVILCDFPPSPPKALTELLDYARENSCVLFPSHPFDVTRDGLGNEIFKIIDKIKFIEIYNSKAPGSANRKAEELARSKGLIGLANSDSHVKEALGSAYNLVEAEPRPEDVLEAIRKGKVEPRPVGLAAKAKLSIAKWFIVRKLGLAQNPCRAVRQV
ncbi:MAG: PHP-associated domain-containing protein [Thermoprotei archaeon]